jgi:hypothetical protein
VVGSLLRYRFGQVRNRQTHTARQVRNESIVVQEKTKMYKLNVLTGIEKKNKVRERGSLLQAITGQIEKERVLVVGKEKKN